MQSILQTHPLNPLRPTAFSGYQPFALRPPALPAFILEMLARPVDSFQPSAETKQEHTAPLTHVGFVLDESGSMALGKAETVEGFNEQVRVLKEGAAQAGTTRFTEVKFNSTVWIQCIAGDVVAAQPLTMERYKPDGGTALYDALGLTIESLLQTEGIGAPNTAILITAFTDGNDNASQRYTAAILQALIERLEATGRWTFALVGPSNGVTAMAKSLAIKAANIAGFDVSSALDKKAAFGKVASASAAYMTMRSVGRTQACALYAPNSSD